MPFFDKIRRALGFSDGEDDIDDAIIRDDAPSGMYRHMRHGAGSAPAIQPSQPEAPKPAASTTPRQDDADRAAAIFDRVLEVFNRSLPDFLKQSVDPEAQRKYLYKSLDDGLKAYIASLKDQAAREAEARWRKDNDALQTSVKNLEQRAREIEDKRTEISQKQMSSDRQRRALSERVHDLESTVARLEAEKEQFELERQSMINKLKVAAVYEKENTELHEQIEQMIAKRGNAATETADSAVIESLNAQVAEARQQAEDARKQAQEAEQARQQIQEEVNKLNDRIVELQIDLEDASTAKTNDKSALEDLNAQVAEACKQVEDAHKQAEDYRKQAEDARKQAQETELVRQQIQEEVNKLNDRILELQIDLEEATTAKNNDKSAVDALNARAEEARKQIEELRGQVQAEQRKNAEAQSTIRVLQRQIEEDNPMDDPEIQRQLKEIQDRLDHYEQQKKRNEETIASLKSQLEDERRKNSADKAAPKPAAKTAETTLPSDETMPKNKTPRPVSSKPAKSTAPQNAPSIDDILGDTDWVVRQDSTSKSRQRNAERTKPKIDDDPQMKLF